MIMESPDKSDLLHVALGNEEETMLMVGAPNAHYGMYHEAYDFLTKYPHFIPEDIKHVSRLTGGRFMQNGGLVYNGGSKDGGANLERATPECSSPAEFALAVQANELLVVKMLSNYVRDGAETEFPIGARLQRRVIDSLTNGRASHDSIQVANVNWLRNFKTHPQNELLLMAHLATRSCITGAGYVTEQGWKFAQKIQYTDQLEAYGYLNSAYRRLTSDLDDTGARLEIRCNDINISPWAVKQRIGTSALLLAAMQTPLKYELLESMPEVSKNSSKRLRNLRRFNTVATDELGVLQSSAKIHRAIDFQERMYTAIGAYLPDLTDVPDNYLEIIEEGTRYCHDLRKVLQGSEDISLLTDRSDYAVKFQRIQRSLRRAAELGIEHAPNDINAMKWDMKYDCIEVLPNGSGKPRVEYGYGYKHRDTRKFRDVPPPAKVQSALYNAPLSTRAHLRGQLIKLGEVQKCDWNRIQLDTIDPPYEDLSHRIIKTDQTLITPEQAQNVKQTLQQYYDW